MILLYTTPKGLTSLVGTSAQGIRLTLTRGASVVLVRIATLCVTERGPEATAWMKCPELPVLWRP